MSTHPFTPEYIAMARAAKEIQASWQRAPGDYIHTFHPLYGETDAELLTDERPAPEEGWVAHWLPRLDQLLRMLDGPDEFVDSAFRAGADNDGDGHFDAFISRGISYKGIQEWHELALAVVMREKYGKRWDRKTWVKV